MSECAGYQLGTEMGDGMLETLIVTPRAAGTGERREEEPGHGTLSFR